MTKQEAERRIEYWLETFGENITRIDHAIELLQDLYLIPKVVFLFGSYIF
ncbi:hypothetical protein [Nostoc sp. CALU 1950]